MSGQDIPGYRLDQVEPWVCDHVEGFVRPFTWTKLEGGHSNLTYLIRSADGSHEAVIRRPPLGQLLPKAHDMGREWACISALWPTAVPVAQPLAFCPSPDVTGAHFYVMGVVDGRAMYTVGDVEEWIAPENRPVLAGSWIDVLAELHSLDPDELGLEGLGRKEDYVARQINRWYGSWTASAEAADIDTPLIHEMHDRLLTDIPPQGPARVVHGDYGTHNVLVGRDGHIRAVVDWEIATLGDPLADLGYAINFWARPGDPMTDRLDTASMADGFPDREWLIERYARHTGQDLSSLPFYLAYNRFKSACIIHGVYARYRNGQKEIDPVELAEMRERVMRSVDMAARAYETIR